MATIKGRIEAISVSKEKGVQKSNVSEAELRAGHGIVGDAHAGAWHRQVSLLPIESVQKMIDKGAEVGPGDFAENITTSGIALQELPVGTKLAVGEGIMLEVTQIGKECHSRCAIYEKAGDCVMPREGIFAKVLEGGIVRVGDLIEVRDD